MSRLLRSSVLKRVLALSVLSSTACAAIAIAANNPTARTAVVGTAYKAARNLSPPNLPVGPAFTTILTRRVPPGLYVVNAKVTVIESARTSLGGDCILLVDRNEQDRANESPANTSVTARSTFPLQFAGPVRKLVTLQCRAGQPWRASDAKITALGVAAVQ
jgi:hypothetical protein